MRSVNKTNSKKGFTLLEVMLSVALLTIVSTMIMTGFLATMNYSSNNSVYARLGSKNYDEALMNVAKNSSITANPARDNALLASGGTTTTINYSAIGAGGGASGTVRVVQWRIQNTDPHINVVSRAGAGNSYDETSNVSRRTSFFYVPSNAHVCSTCGNSLRYGKSYGVTGWYCTNTECEVSPLYAGD